MSTRESASSGIPKYVAGRDEIIPIQARNSIPFFLGCDDNFFAHAISVTASVLESASSDNNYDVFIIQSGVRDEKLLKALEWVRRYPNASLRFVDVGNLVDSIGRDSFQTTRHLSIAMFFRIFAPTVFANYDKIAYLDSDIAVLADIAGFYNQDLGDNLLGACHDFVTERQSLVNPAVAEFWKRELGKNPGEDYFFSGGVVMNLGQMREEGIEALMQEKLRTLKGSYLPDQDLMNAVLNGRVKYIDCEWNYLDWMTDSEEESQDFGLVDEKALALIREARNHYKVLHFSEKKPWSAGYVGKNESVYWRYAALTPFYEETLAKFRAECSPRKTIPRFLVAHWQILNFRVRSLFATGRAKEKYAARLNNLKFKKRRLLGLMRRFGPLGYSEAKS